MRIEGGDWNIRVIGAIDRLVDGVREEFYANAEDAAQLMRDIISTSSTPTGLARGTTGRIDTSTMIDNVKVWNTDRRKYIFDVAFGWKPEDFATERTPTYPLLQDQGFTHVPDGAWIPGMHALQDARAEFLVKTTNTLNKLIK